MSQLNAKQCLRTLRYSSYRSNNPLLKDKSLSSSSSRQSSRAKEKYSVGFKNSRLHHRRRISEHTRETAAPHPMVMLTTKMKTRVLARRSRGNPNCHLSFM